MNRRALLFGSVCSLPVLLSRKADAANSCGPNGCTAQVSFPQFAANYDPQHQSQWCWAACISMVFRYYGHPVSQQRIVTEAYGAPFNIPAGAGFVIAQALNRPWIDDRGRPFQASLQAAFDAQAGVAAINNAMIVQALAGGHPLIVGARTHAMVVTAVSYIPTPMGPNITQVGVFDPFPGVGARGLAPDEMTPVQMGGSLLFLALTNVS